MAGFQKFPVPKWVFYSPWAYNKKWKGHAMSVAGGSLLFCAAAMRYHSSKQVLFG